MPAKRFTKSARKLLDAPKLTVRAMKLGRMKSPFALEDVPLRPGMNQWESRVAQALEELKIPYQAQATFFGGSVLGGGRADFLLPTYKIDLEVNGPMHGTTYGLGRDVLRNAGVQAQGFRVVSIGLEDFPRLKPRILEIVGQPLFGR